MMDIKTVPTALAVVLTILSMLAATPPAVAVETSRVADCPAGYTNTGLTCYRGPDSIGNGGSIVADCPSGYTNTGLTCLRPADTQPNGGSTPANCPTGYTNTGLSCFRGADSYSAPSTVADCPSGYTNTGLTCFRPYDTASCSTSSFGFCTSCPSGYYNAGVFCARDADTKPLSSMTCPSGRFFSAGRCYVNCNSGYTNTGETCFRTASTLGESFFTCQAGTFYSTGRCYQPCSSGYTNTGISCYRAPDTLGGDSMSCPIDRFLSLGRCYFPCPTGYTNTGTTCLRPADTLGASSMSCRADEILQVVRCYPNISASLNGAQIRPFWIYGHNPNTIDEAKAALDAGANALEPDIMYLSGAQYYVGQTLPDGLYVYHDDVQVLTRLPQTVEDYLDGIHDLAVSYPSLSLVVLDIKTPAAAASGSAKKIYDAVHQHLLRDGQPDAITLNVIYSVAQRYPDGGNIFPDLIPLVTPGTREGLMVDGEDNPEQVQTFFKARGTQRFAFGDGTAGANLTGIGPNTLRAIEKYAWLRAKSGTPQTAYAFAIQDQETLKEYITTGVDAIITDTVADLATIVKGRTDIRLATRDDNPLTPLTEAYALQVHTGNVVDAGTDANVTFTLTGCLGQATGVVDTSRIGRMEQDSTNYLAIPGRDLGRLTSLTVSRDDQGLGQGWWLDKVDITSYKHLSTKLYNGTDTITGTFQNWVPTTGLTATLSTDPCTFAVTGLTLSRQQGSPAGIGTLATVLNTENIPDFVLTTPPGAGTAGINGTASPTLTYTGNYGGTISALLGATCTAAVGPHIIGIEAYDRNSGLTASGNATINVTANTPPTLGTYPDVILGRGAEATVHPGSTPSDNGQVVSLTATAPGFSGIFVGNPVTGSLIIANAAPVGDYTVSVVAKDDCGATSTHTFKLTVNASSVPLPLKILGIPDIYVQSLTQALDITQSYSSGSDITMQSQGVTLTGNLNLANTVNIFFSGGYDSSFTTRSGMTTLQGILTVGKGSLVVDHLAIK